MAKAGKDSVKPKSLAKADASVKPIIAVQTETADVARPSSEVKAAGKSATGKSAGKKKAPSIKTSSKRKSKPSSKPSPKLSSKPSGEAETTGEVSSPAVDRTSKDQSATKAKAVKKSPDKAGLAPELRQVAALPLRVEGGHLQVCLVTTRETRRWTVPKGWPMKGIKDYKAAAIEAEQEAGILGKIRRKAVGDFLYWKRRDLHFDLVRVFVYRLDVLSRLQVWREMGEREVRWFSPRDAALLVEEAGLSTLLATLDTVPAVA